MNFRSYYHAHDCWYNSNMPCQKEADNETRRKMTERNEAYIQALEYNLVTIRECEWRAMKVRLNIQADCSAMHNTFYPDNRWVIWQSLDIGLSLVDWMRYENNSENCWYLPVQGSHGVSAEVIIWKKHQSIKWVNKTFTIPRPIIANTYFSG